jgi:hypothetical protein
MHEFLNNLKSQKLDEKTEGKLDGKYSYVCVSLSLLIICLDLLKEGKSEKRIKDNEK